MKFLHDQMLHENVRWELHTLSAVVNIANNKENWREHIERIKTRPKVALHYHPTGRRA
jgi:hypothetical protein